MDDISKTLKRVKETRDYRRSNDNQDYVADLEKSLEELKSVQGFLKLDYIVAIRKKLKSVIVSAKLKLLDEDDPEKRQQIRADVLAYSWLLPFFSRNVDKEFEEIDSKLQDML